MEVNELLKKVRRIELKTRDLSNHLFSGDYHSKFKGRGMSFAEVREYQYSDDIRHIDWNVTARTGVPFVKIFEEERELTVFIVIDVSKSSFFGSNEKMKKDIITEVSAVLAFSAIQNNDKVGLILFSDHVEKFIPPAKGRNHILRIIRDLVSFEPTGTRTNIQQAMAYLNNIVKQHCICFLISDFLDDNYAKALKVAGRRHDLIGVHVHDPMEKMLPKAGMLYVIDPETNQKQWIDTNDPTFRNAYSQFFAQHASKVKQELGSCNVDLISIATDEDYFKSLIKFFRSR